jgi:hypothetical protein
MPLACSGRICVAAWSRVRCTFSFAYRTASPSASRLMFAAKMIATSNAFAPFSSVYRPTFRSSSLFTSTYAMLVGPDFVGAACPGRPWPWPWPCPLPWPCEAAAGPPGAADAAAGTIGAATMATSAATIPIFMDFCMTLLFEWCP